MVKLLLDNILFIFMEGVSSVRAVFFFLTSLFNFLDRNEQIFVVNSKLTVCTYHHHGNGEIGSELIVTPGTGGTICVFVNASFVHQLWILFMLFLWIWRHIEHLLKVILDPAVPLLVRHSMRFTWRKKQWWWGVTICPTVMNHDNYSKQIIPVVQDIML